MTIAGIFIAMGLLFGVGAPTEGYPPSTPTGTNGPAQPK